MATTNLNWGEPERTPHWAVVCPSSFVNVLYLMCATVNRNLTVHNTLLTCGVLTMVSNVCREVDEVREEKLR